MTDTTGKIAKNLERFAQAVAAHDRRRTDAHRQRIGLAHFDLERLGWRRARRSCPASRSTPTAA